MMKTLNSVKIASALQCYLVGVTARLGSLSGGGHPGRISTGGGMLPSSVLNFLFATYPLSQPASTLQMLLMDNVTY